MQDIGLNRLADFENVGAYYAHLLSYARSYEERYGEFEEPALPIRSPPIYKFKNIINLNEVQTSSKPFGITNILNTFKN